MAQNLLNVVTFHIIIQTRAEIMQVVLLSKIKMNQKLEMYPRGMFL